MAATAVYFSVVKIPYGGSLDEAVRFVNVNASPAAFNLTGGKYGVKCKASTYGTVTLKVLADDNATFLTALTGFAADGFAAADLPQGNYQVVVG